MKPKSKKKIIHAKVVHLEGEDCLWCKQSNRENEAWRRGYETGLKANQEATSLGKAIIDILDNRYEFKKEDY